MNQNNSIKQISENYKNKHQNFKHQISKNNNQSQINVYQGNKMRLVDFELQSINKNLPQQYNFLINKIGIE